jgi:hypothetical protein
MADPLAAPDQRKVRAEQAVVAIALLAGFVFRVAWVVPLVVVVVALGVARPESNVVWRLWDAAVASRLRGGAPSEDPALVRLESLVVAVVLTLATAGFAAGLEALGWFLALLVAVHGAVAATTRFDPVRATLLRLARSA